jgi:hypothetical protein
MCADVSRRNLQSVELTPKRYNFFGHLSGRVSVVTSRSNPELMFGSIAAFG